MTPHIMRLLILLATLSTAALGIGGGIPLMRRKIAPNYSYGFRTQVTMTDPEIWYRVNEYFGRLMVRWMSLFFLFAVTLYFPRGISDDAYFLIASGGLVLTLLVVCTASFLYYRSIIKQEQ